jgi:hypothetical protein
MPRLGKAVGPAARNASEEVLFVTPVKAAVQTDSR